MDLYTDDELLLMAENKEITSIGLRYIIMRGYAERSEDLSHKRIRKLPLDADLLKVFINHHYEEMEHAIKSEMVKSWLTMVEENREPKISQQCSPLTASNLIWPG